MKITIALSFISLLFFNDTPIKRDKIYISPTKESIYEVFRVLNDSVIVYDRVGKHNEFEYDFFEDKYLGFIRKWFFSDEVYIKKNSCNYKRKGDSLFIDRSDEVMLNLITFGEIKGDKVYMKSLYRIFNASTKKYDVIRTDEGLVFTPY